jgi:tetratricopeptide (TPR) repeat protein
MNAPRRLTHCVRLIALWFSAALAYGISPCFAEIPGYPGNVETAFDAREIALLPRYCIHTQLFRNVVPGGDNPAEIKRWQSIMGEKAFEALHHYCWGLMKTNRAIILSRTQQDRKFYLADSIGEFDYVMRSAPRDFVLLPEILTRKGDNLLRLGRIVQGIMELERAIEIKPDYWPPYEVLSEHYKSVGNRSKARELLERAMKYSPDSKTLKLRLSELDAVDRQRKPSP